MATITRRKTGWQAKVRIKGYPAQTRTFPSRREAESWALAAEADMRRDRYLDPAHAQRTLLKDVIESFSLNYAPFHYKQRADQKEAWRFQCKTLRERLGSYSIAAIDQRVVAAFRDSRRREVSASTVRKDIFMLSKVLKYAEQELGIVLPHGNPVLKIAKPSDGKARDRRLSKQEWEAFERECRKSRNRLLWPAVQLAVETGMRQGEILSLQWSEIDLQHRIAILLDTKNGEARAVPLSSRAIEILNQLRGNDKSASGRVIPLARMTLHHAFLYARRRAGIKDFAFHDLRHEALSRLAERGDLSVLELAAISGHKTLQMLKRYTHLQAEKLAQKLG